MMEKAFTEFLIEFLTNQIRTLQQIFSRLEQINPIDEDRTNSLAYLIHNYYSCTEDAIKEIVKVFDGKGIAKGENYHKDLLAHAKFDLNGFRPAIISSASFKCLEEILRFRHRFRHAYNYVLDPKRVKENKSLIIQNHSILLDDLNHFLAFLKGISED